MAASLLSQPLTLGPQSIDKSSSTPTTVAPPPTRLTLEVSIVTRLDLGNGVADSLTDDVKISFVQPLLNFDVASHGVSGLVEVVKMLQMAKLVTKNFKLFQSTFHVYHVTLEILKGVKRYRENTL